MNEYLIPLTSACTLVTLNYIAMKIRSRMIIESYEEWLAPLFTGIASIMMMLEPLPEPLGLVDLRSLPIFMAGLRYGPLAAVLSTLLPGCYGILAHEDQPYMMVVQELLSPALLSSLFYNRSYRSAFMDIPIRHSLQLCILVFFIRLLTQFYHHPILTWGYALNQLFMLLTTIVTFIILVVMVNDENRSWRLQRQLELQANQDGLTRLPNLRSFMTIAKKTLTKRAISIFMIDIDHFKQFNDQFGHLDGDQLLRDMASILRNSIQEQDYIARYGGEEFILLSTETSPAVLEHYANHLCRTVAHYFSETSTLSIKPITISIGISTARDLHDDLQRIVGEADQALYLSKKTGKNRYTLMDSAKQQQAQKNAY
ncbi:GGDEF domain-containing protein [Paenibacillus hexagrammi]|uniref:GGDEF domain-containing protein n=1 Tax=Paenibacillus hexagrammi TaxID=2908839 RepID=A0ABY3SEB1_9BACL|nr:GGDEF domain-containing protein [Paenibacillus sp. YPD9-1]UJF32328.1 GGDEF domain-containing protein [Paenibacillus sp. YPD9-1]